MLLRSRVILIVSLAFAAVAAGLGFANLKREELADRRFAEATIGGQDIIWRKIIENATQRLQTIAPSLTGTERLAQAIRAQDRTALIELAQPVFEQLREAGRLDRLEITDREGRLVYSSTGEVFPTPLLDAALLARVIAAGQTVRGVQQDASRLYAAAVAMPVRDGDEVVGALTLGLGLGEALDEFEGSTGADGFLIDQTGGAVHATNPALWATIGPQMVRLDRTLADVRVRDRVYLVASFPVVDMAGRTVARLATAKDTTEQVRRREVIAHLSLAGAAAFVILVLLALYGYLQRAFGPLDEAINVLNAISRGDTSVNVESPGGNDEIGRIASTVEIFRRHAIQLDLLSRQRERQRRRQEKLIRREMQSLADTLEDQARAAVLQDLAQIEEVSNAATEDGAQGPAGGSLSTLAVALRTMTRRISEQQRSLQQLVEERTRDLETVREALRQKEQLAALRQELDFARQLQLSSLPTRFPDSAEFQIHASMIPAREVGGDYYDFFQLGDDRIAIVVGDASGKGVSAAMFIAMARSLLRALLRATDPASALAQTNDLLAADNASMMFATIFVGVVDLAQGELIYANAGHNPPFLLIPGRAPEMLPGTGDMALGVMEGQDYRTQRRQIPPGATLVLYSDGVTEATDTAGGLFGDARLEAALTGGDGLAPAAVVDVMQASTAAFVGEAPQADDMTFLVLRYLGPATAAAAVRATA